MAWKLLKQSNEPGQKLFTEASKDKSGEELHFLENDLTFSGNDLWSSNVLVVVLESTEHCSFDL